MPGAGLLRIANGESTWYKRFNTTGIADMGLDEIKPGSWRGKAIPGGATFSKIDRAVGDYIFRDHIPNVDGYAGSQIKMMQLAHRWVVMRLARVSAANKSPEDCEHIWAIT